MGKICCFTGHRPARFPFKYDESHPHCIRIKDMIKQEIKNAIDEGYDYFISGMAMGVDTWSAEAVLELKRIYPHIKLEAAIPCLDQEKVWSLSAQQRYHGILSKADVIHYVSEEPYKPHLMIKRNEYMVDKSSLLISVFFDDSNGGGTAYTFSYALKKGIIVVRIDPKSFRVIVYNK